MFRTTVAPAITIVVDEEDRGGQCLASGPGSNSLHSIEILGESVVAFLRNSRRQHQEKLVLAPLGPKGGVQKTFKRVQ